MLVRRLRLYILTDRASIILIPSKIPLIINTWLFNPGRGLPDKKISEEHLQNSNESTINYKNKTATVKINF